MQHGRPDEQRAGRAILKDYINGKLLHCVGPKGYRGEMGVEGDAIFGVAREEGERNRAREARRAFDDEIEPATVGGDSASIESSSGKNEDPLAKQLLAEMMEELGGLDGKAKPEKARRAEHKFQKKSKVKGRIKHKGFGEDETAGGNGFKMGKKGGMMPASVQATVRSAVGDE